MDTLIWESPDRHRRPQVCACAMHAYCCMTCKMWGCAEFCLAFRVLKCQALYMSHRDGYIIMPGEDEGHSISRGFVHACTHFSDTIIKHNARGGGVHTSKFATVMCSCVCVTSGTACTAQLMLEGWRWRTHALAMLLTTELEPRDIHTPHSRLPALPFALCDYWVVQFLMPCEVNC